MKERPILFSGPMVQAILNHQKTQTRRIIKEPAPSGSVFEPRNGDGLWFFRDAYYASEDNDVGNYVRCPYGVPGDRLWVRETFRPWRHPGKGYVRIEYDCTGTKWVFRPSKPYTFPDDDDGELKILKNQNPKRWIRCRRMPSIFMPRWASRITLEIVSVRVERVQGISDADAKEEGIVFRRGESGIPGFFIGDETVGNSTSRGRYWRLWDSINGKTYPWESNPWVWVVEFKML